MQLIFINFIKRYTRDFYYFITSISINTSTSIRFSKNHILKKIYHNLFDSTGFIADLSDFSDFIQSALPGVIPSQFFKWCETGRYL